MKKKKYGFRKGLLALFAVMGMAQLASAQVGIGTATPDASAQLQIESTNKGILIPRVVSAEDVTAPATGLMVYQTGGAAGFYYNSGTAIAPIWLKIATGSTGIADGSITNAKVSSSAAIAYSKLNLTGSITGTDLAPMSVTSANLAPMSVTGVSLAPMSVSGSNIISGTITGSNLGTGVISTVNIAPNAVINGNISDGAVTTSKIASTGASSGQVLGFNGSSVAWTTPSAGGSLVTPLFSAFISSFSTSSSTVFTSWSTSEPYYNDGSFNALTGSFTVPETGRYFISANVNYSTTAAVTVGLGAGIDPSFVIRRTAPVTTDLVTGIFPVFNVNIALVLTLRTILANANVPLATTVQLNEGDVLQLAYRADGLTIGLDMGSAGQGVQWSVTKLDEHSAPQ